MPIFSTNFDNYIINITLKTPFARLYQSIHLNFKIVIQHPIHYDRPIQNIILQSYRDQMKNMWGQVLNRQTYEHNIYKTNLSNQ